MIDAFVLLTPILVFGIVALLAFVGCDLVFSIPPIPPPVAHVQTTVNRGAAGTDTITADPLSLEGGELIVVTVQWSSPAVQPPNPVLTGLVFAPVVGGGPFPWNNMRVQAFVATNPEQNTQLAVEVTLAGGSSATWHLCVSAYKDFDENTPVYSPQQNGPGFIGTNPQAPTISGGNGDLVYAVAFGADNNGTFPGNNFFTPGPGFAAEFPPITNPLVEDAVSNAPTAAQATNTTQALNPRGFIFAMGVKARPNS
jgi:hypothetical protein